MASTGLPSDTAASAWRRVFRYGVVLAISAALHAAVWHFKDALVQEPETKPKPITTIEVSLVAAPSQTSAAKELEPRKSEATKPEPKIEPKPVAIPKPAPQPRPKPPPAPKFKPPPKPSAVPEPPPPAERPVPEESHAPPKPRADSSPPPSRPADAEGSPTTARTWAENTAKEGAKGETFEHARADAAYLHNPKPEYPAVARHRQWEGKVVLRVKVLADGSCGHAEVHQSSGHEPLDEAALDAVRNWRFVPAKRGGQPVESWVNIPINFNLE